MVCNRLGLLANRTFVASFFTNFEFVFAKSPWHCFLLCFFFCLFLFYFSLYFFSLFCMFFLCFSPFFFF